MTARQRLIAGVGSILWLPVGLVIIATMLPVDEGDTVSTGVSIAVAVALLVALGLGVAALVLMMRHIYRYSALSERGQTFWTAILIVFNLYAAPFYYAVHVRTRA